MWASNHFQMLSCNYSSFLFFSLFAQIIQQIVLSRKKFGSAFDQRIARSRNERRWEWLGRERTWDARRCLRCVGSSPCVCVRELSGPGRYPDMRASCAFHHQRRHRHHDAAYRDAKCGSVSISIPLSSRSFLPISLSRDTRYECTSSPSLSSYPYTFLSLSVICLISYFARTANFFHRWGLLGCDRGCSHQCLHATA